jgi:DNA-binding transcriptional MerR regulator
VTVKALHLYDRLGLLVAARSEAGHRIYTSADLRRLRHIVALKRLGVPLRRIGAILANADALLDATFRHQRRALEDRRDVLDGLIRALRQSQDASATGTRSPSDILDLLSESMTMEDSIDAMRKYYSAESWPAWRKYYEDWPSDEWRSFYHDVIRALDADPDLYAGSEVAQSFATRWLVLDAQDTAHPAVRLGLRRAWVDRKNWPEALRTRFEELQGERVARFVSDALWERWDAERTAREHRTGVRARVSDARRRLYRDGTALLGHDPSSEAARNLRARWEAILDDETGGDMEMKAEMIRIFKARRQWPAGLVRSMASSYELDAATWSGVADLLEAAHDQAGSRDG